VGLPAKDLTPAPTTLLSAMSFSYATSKKMSFLAEKVDLVIPPILGRHFLV
jgi:hypothetical protein